MASRLAAARARARANFNRALVDLGVSDLGQLGKFGQYIDQDSLSQAAANKYSTMAQIAQQQRKSTAMSDASLAARGILRSGQTTENRENIVEAAEGARYNALRNFLSMGEEGLASLADLEAELAGDVARARGAAGQRAAELYPGGLPPGPGGNYFSSPASSSYWNAVRGYGAPPPRKPKKPRRYNRPGFIGGK